MSGETVITIVGNLTSDPEMRYTQNGLAVVNMTIASTARVFDRAANEWKDGDALFLRASVWREFAEHVAGSLTKGTRVIASGRLRQRSYETKADSQGNGGGEKRTSMELEIDEIGPSLRYATASLTRVQSNNQAQQGQQQQGQQQRPQQTQQQRPQQSQQRPQQGNDQPWAPIPPTGGSDVWGQNGYADETPF
ncbi:single-stranded DNA-binding protein [Cryobacterium psychrophilum]|uniref:Single-stranded DNA-binding protein n=1 Tax=Cryobacterium psychrophilum TaxID=41988 RepID=A0A4Y8KPZ5_9MICO|nr:single-stranded DNA-binding protein [Cryobacterium psychrophilum]TDW30999.1 single-strand DNA-binding protein [Cryobacterium psychrophilum]TFD80858.1 single-stranded DNA-binding protein [Cryobacterium psychrophilum]